MVLNAEDSDGDDGGGFVHDSSGKFIHQSSRTYFLLIKKPCYFHTMDSAVHTSTVHIIVYLSVCL